MVESQKGTKAAPTKYKVYGVSALLVLNGLSLNSNSALLVLSQRYRLSKPEDLKRGIIKHCAKPIELTPFWFSTEHITGLLYNEDLVSYMAP